MTPAADMPALAETVEAATGPDRELDREICLAIRNGRWISPSAVPSYTASIDAAMTLVPEGYFIRKLIQFGVEGPWGAVIAYAPQLHMPEPESVADTPALALSAAALRASSLLGGDHE
jgi:hypothetical protein